MNIETAKTLKKGDRIRLTQNAAPGHTTAVVTHVFEDGIQVKCECGGSNIMRFDSPKIRITEIVPQPPATPAPTHVTVGVYEQACDERDSVKRDMQQLDQMYRSCREARNMWMKRAYGERKKVEELTTRLEEARRGAKAWEESALQNSRNEAWLRDLLLQIAEVLGPEKFISDDGSIQQDVLIAKVPELARAAILRPLVAEQKAKIVPMPMTPQTDGFNRPAGRVLPAGEHKIDDRIVIMGGFPIVNQLA